MMTLEQYQEREGLLDRIDDLESKLSALQSERDDLKMQLGLAIITYDDLLEVSLKETGRLQSERDQLKKALGVLINGMEALFCDSENDPSFEGSDGDHNEFLKYINNAYEALNPTKKGTQE